MSYQRQQAAVQAAKNKTQQDYGLALEMYKIPEPEASQEELRFLLNEIKLMRLKQTASGVARVVDMLDRASAKKSPSCGCNGKSGSAGKYETKSVMSSTRRMTKSSGLFASAYEQVQADAEYEAFCSKFPYMCNER